MTYINEIDKTTSKELTEYYHHILDTVESNIRNNYNNDEIDRELAYSIAKILKIKDKDYYQIIHNIIDINKSIESTEEETTLQILKNIHILQSIKSLRLKDLNYHITIMNSSYSDSVKIYNKNHNNKEIMLIDIHQDFENLLFQQENKLRIRPLVYNYGLFSHLPILCDNYCTILANKYIDIEKAEGNFIDDELNVSNTYKLFYLSCLFAHNSNEVNYHPLEYRTTINKKLVNKDYYASNTSDLEYFQLNEEIFSAVTKLLKSYTYTPTKLNKEENLKIKTQPCKNGLSCQFAKTQTCLDFHNKFEKRRPLFMKNNAICKSVFESLSGKWLDPLLCQNEDHCEYFHTKNELLYDYRNYRRLNKCPIEDKNGICTRGNLCFYHHITDIDIDELLFNNKDKQYYKKIFIKELQEYINIVN